MTSPSSFSLFQSITISHVTAIFNYCRGFILLAIFLSGTASSYADSLGLDNIEIERFLVTALVS